MNDAEITPYAVDIKAARAQETGTKALTVFGREWGNLTKFPISLSKLENLEKLTISRPVIEDLTLITGMKSLKELTLEFATLQDLSPLAQLENLRILNLNYSTLDKTSSISKLRQIESFSWVEGNLENTDPFQHLTDLVRLELRRSKVTSLQGLSKLTKLQQLDLSDTAVNELRPLSADRRLRRQNAALCTNDCNHGPHRSISMPWSMAAMGRSYPSTQEAETGHSLQVQCLIAILTKAVTVTINLFPKSFFCA